MLTNLAMMMSSTLYSNKQRPYSLCIRDNLISSQLTLSKYSVNKCYWHFTHCIPKCSCSHHHLHLEHIAFRLCNRDNMSQHPNSVKPRSASTCNIILEPQFTPYRKLPVRSLTPGFNIVSAKKFAPLDTNLRRKSQPWTPPGAASAK